MSGQMYDAPNQEAVGLDPPWVEGTGGPEGDPAPEPEPQEQEQEQEPEAGADLDAMTKAELLAYAQQLGVSPANNDMTKDEIRAGVEAKLAEGG